jgi:hypothetical protein
MCHQENSNVDTVASLSEENRKIILLERQLLEHKHKLEVLNDEHKHKLEVLKLNDEHNLQVTVLKLNDEIEMLKLKRALDMLQVEQVLKSKVILLL